MSFYASLYKFYCGIDLHARSMCVCIIDSRGKILVQKHLEAGTEALMETISSHIGGIVVAVECMLT